MRAARDSVKLIYYIAFSHFYFDVAVLQSKIWRGRTQGCNANDVSSLAASPSHALIKLFQRTLFPYRGKFVKKPAKRRLAPPLLRAVIKFIKLCGRDSDSCRIYLHSHDTLPMASRVIYMHTQCELHRSRRNSRRAAKTANLMLAIVGHSA